MHGKACYKYCRGRIKDKRRQNLWRNSGSYRLTGRATRILAAGSCSLSSTCGSFINTYYGTESYFIFISTVRRSTPHTSRRYPIPSQSIPSNPSTYSMYIHLIYFWTESDTCHKLKNHLDHQACVHSSSCESGLHLCVLPASQVFNMEAKDLLR